MRFFLEIIWEVIRENMRAYIHLFVYPSTAACLASAIISKCNGDDEKLLKSLSLFAIIVVIAQICYLIERIINPKEND
jgi:hypothetical protein